MRLFKIKSLKEKIIYKPAFFLLLALLTGILLSYFLISHNLFFIQKLLLIFEFIYFCYYFLFCFKLNKKRIIIFLMITFLIVGSLLSTYQEYKYNSKYSITNFSGEKSDILAKISFDIGDLESNKVYLKPLIINDKKVKYGKIICYSNQLNHFKEGDLIFLNLTLVKAKKSLNPGGFSYDEYLKKDGIYLQGKKAANIKLVKSKRTFKNIIIRFKKRLLTNINFLFDKENAAFIKAILLGEKEYLSYEQESLLRNSGASHLLAISGLHMGIIILTFSFILFKIFSKKRTALYFLTILTLVYIVIVGAAVSIIRAALLALLFLWADEFNREGDFLNIISFTMIVNLILNPAALFTVSLQLSYLLVFSLFYLSPLLNRIMPSFLAVSLAAQLGAFGISVFYFNEYSWISIVTNIWVIPLISIILPIIFIIVFLSLFIINFLIHFIFIIDFALEFLFSSLTLMTKIQGLPIVIAKANIFLLFSYYILLFSLPLIYQKQYLLLKVKKIRKKQVLTTLLFLLTFILFFINFDSGLLEINYLAVGQGDGIFIKFPNAKNMIIDTGPPGSDGRNVEYNLVSFLNHNGIKKIDYLMISHFDADHVGGLPHLLERKKVKNILIPPFKDKGYFHKKLETALSKNQKINLIYLKEGINFEIDGCILRILNPQNNYLSDDRNENSIVFLLNYQNKKFLFTGDLSQKGENRIVDKYKLGKIDVLKAGHHGSKTSTGEKLLQSTLPSLAVISVGKNNFGHPAAEVLARLNKYNVNYLRTDINGLIKVSSNGEKIWYNSFR